MSQEEGLKSIMQAVESKKGYKPSKEESVAILKTLNAIFTEGKIPAEAMGFSKELCNFIYANGYRLFQSGKYADAFDIFWLMHQLDPYDIRYLMGMATTRHRQKIYHEAIVYYVSWGLLDLRDPNPLYHAADCYIALNDLDNACRMLKAMVERCKGFSNLQKLQTRGEAMIQSLGEQTVTRK